MTDVPSSVKFTKGSLSCPDLVKVTDGKGRPVKALDKAYEGTVQRRAALSRGPQLPLEEPANPLAQASRTPSNVYR